MNDPVSFSHQAGPSYSLKTKKPGRVTPARLISCVDLMLRSISGLLRPQLPPQTSHSDQRKTEKSDSCPTVRNRLVKRLLNLGYRHEAATGYPKTNVFRHINTCLRSTEDKIVSDFRKWVRKVANLQMTIGENGSGRTCLPHGFIDGKERAVSRLSATCVRLIDHGDQSRACCHRIVQLQVRSSCDARSCNNTDIAGPSKIINSTGHRCLDHDLTCIKIGQINGQIAEIAKDLIANGKRGTRGARKGRQVTYGHCIRHARASCESNGKQNCF